MDEDVTDQTAGAPQSGPAAAAGGATVIEAFPGELGAGGAIARAVAHVEIGFDSEKREFTVVLATEGNVGRSGQVDLVPLVHLGDPPSPGKGPGEARRASRHIALISFGNGPDRMRPPQRQRPIAGNVSVGPYSSTAVPATRFTTVVALVRPSEVGL